MNKDRIKVLPGTLQKFFEVTQNEFLKIIPGNIVGIYVYGSISYNAFEAQASDVDVAVILKQKLSRQELHSFEILFQGEMLESNPWLSKLEMDYIVLSDITPILKNHVFTTRFSGGRLKTEQSFEGVVLDLENIRSCGIILYGKDPKSFIPQVSQQLLFEALQEKFLELKLHAFEWVKIDVWNQVYVVASLCRLIYAINHEGKPVSKKAATEWCTKNVPNQFHEIVSIALKHINDFSGPLEMTVISELPALVDYVQEVIAEHPAPPEHR